MSPKPERAFTMPSWQFKLFFDGECPLCRREVEWLKRRDTVGCLAAEDFNAVGFDPARYGLTSEEVSGILHGVKPDGTVLKGMDAVREAYRAVGCGWLLAPTRLPVLRAAADCFYKLFARNRVAMGRLLKRCPGGICTRTRAAGHNSTPQSQSAQFETGTTCKHRITSEITRPA